MKYVSIFYLNIKAQPVTAKRKIARANKLFPLAFPFLSVDLNGIKPITKRFTFFEYKSFFF